MQNDLKGLAITLGGTNFGETDKILRVLFEDGRQAGILAKGLRKSKSKLAGGTQVLAINHIEIHESKSKSMAILTGARMQKFFSNILTDFERMQFAYACMKRVKKAEGLEDPKLFYILEQTLESLNDKNMSVILIKIWFAVNFGVLVGEINDLHYATDGEKLKIDERYAWDIDEKGFYPSKSGKITSQEIQFLRFLTQKSIASSEKVKDWQKLSENIITCGIIKL